MAITHPDAAGGRTGAAGQRARRMAVAALGFAVAAVLLLAAVVAAGRVASERAAAELAGRASAAGSLASAALASTIEKQRLVPMVLSRDPEVVALLTAPSAEGRRALDEKLAAIAAEAAASVLYVVGADGIAIAASNDYTPESFVGSDYAFRRYFTAAMAEGAAQQYALGTVSRRPGLYLSRRVDGPDGPVGVVVVKVEFDGLEARWRNSGLVVQVTDGEGVVLATTNPAWRFGATGPVADPEALRTELQIGDAPFARVPVDLEADGGAAIDGRRFVYAAEPVGASAPGWRLTVFVPAEATLAAASRGAQLTTLLAGLLLCLAGYFRLRRRRWAEARQAALAAMNSELEARVATRTAQLNQSNAALAAEMAERAAVESRARRLRDDLAQANRLSILGQVAAGVAHEINQPVAAIRTYAQTGQQLIDAGAVPEARENLAEIVAVTDRIGAITQSLRGFARRGKGDLRPIEVEAAVDGALALLAGRIRDAGVTIRREPVLPGATVTAGRIRLEQILVNLMQNALDAIAGQPDPTITIGVRATDLTTAITVRDNGPGIPDEVRDQLFMPFTTTKEKGLGLGLVISGDLAHEFGGTLRLEPARPDQPGTAFTLELPRAG